jgi:hypothetical protein
MQLKDQFVEVFSLAFYHYTIGEIWEEAVMLKNPIPFKPEINRTWRYVIMNPTMRP